MAATEIDDDARMAAAARESDDDARMAVRESDDDAVAEKESRQGRSPRHDA